MNCGKILINMNPLEKSLVCFFSEPNFLAVNILESLLSNNCFVNIITDDTKGWFGRTTNIASTNKFHIAGYDTFPKKMVCNYVIFCSGFFKKEKSLSDIKRFLKDGNFQDKKMLLVLPKEVYKNLNLSSLNLPDNVGVIYVGDLLGPRMDLESDLKLPIYLNEIIDKRQLIIPVGEVLYPVFVSDASRQIVKWLFAFGPFGKEVFLLGSDVSSSVFWQTNTKLIGEIKYLSSTDDTLDRLPKNVDNYRVNRDLTYLLAETYRWIKSQPIEHTKPKKTVTKKIEAPAIPNASRRKIKILWLSTLLILVLPILSVLVSSGLTYVSYSQFRAGHDNVALSLLHIGKSISDIAYIESGFLKHVPFFGQVYKETGYISYTAISISEIGIDGIPLLRTGGNLVNDVLGDAPYSIGGVLGGTDERLQQIYDNLSDFEKVSVESKDNGSLAAGYLLSKVSFANYKQLISQIIVITNKMPSVLGSEGSKTYLVLFENNMELRPTGGFVGSYGLLTFDGGRLSDFTISDVYSADGQLNGHVEPPAPIKDYLGEANWWFRDSNWDPDFPTSAKRAEWFLDKEMDRTVDGVISVDLNPIKDFLVVNGPISLQDYNLKISSDNLYEEVQSEVQDNFIPSTNKKASFLTALSRNILSEAGSLSPKEKLSTLKLVYENLNEKHIQVFLHDTDFQRSMSNLGWDGSVFIPSCGDACYSDLMGVVEANVGVNKSNYFVKRSVDVKVDVTGGEIERILTLTLQNLANASLGVSGRYKSYVRLLVPEDSNIIQVTSSFGQNTEILNPEISNAKGRKEIGVLIEVLGGETKKITFKWSGKINAPVSEYNLFFRKQAGVDNYPINLSVDTPTNLLGSNPTFTLTNQGKYVYNTTLVRDLFSRLSF